MSTIKTPSMNKRFFNSTKSGVTILSESKTTLSSEKALNDENYTDPDLDSIKKHKPDPISENSGYTRDEDEHSDDTTHVLGTMPDQDDEEAIKFV
jgi:hypothetical protein